MVGSLPSSEASRSHIAVSGSIGPCDRYSAIPSANQSGGAMAMRVAMPAPARPRDQMSYWNWCTISWMSTCSKSAYDPVKGRTARFRAKSVTPPVPSPPTSVALVCWKSVWEA